MENFLDKIKKDLKKGIEGGLAAVKQGATAASLKVNDLSDEGKRQYHMLKLNLKKQDLIRELGIIVHALLDSGKSVDEDKKIKATYAKIRKLEWQLRKLDGRKTPDASQTPAAKATPKKNPPGKAKKPVRKSSGIPAAKKR